MLTIKASAYQPTCGQNSGGISRVWVFDPADFDWTQPTALGSYSAVALAGTATVLGGSGFFPIKFNYLEGELKSTQTLKGASNKYAHTLTLQVPVFGAELTVFLSHMQEASSCNSLGFVIEMNNGVIMVMGESIVNSDIIPNFRVVMDGTDGGSGKAFDDNNGATLMFKGDYSRPLYDYSGGVSTIIALEGA